MYRTTQTQNFKFDLLKVGPLITFTWQKVTKDLGGTFKCPRRDPCCSSALFQFDTAALPGEASKDRKSRILSLTRPVTSSVTSQITFCIIFGKFKPGAIKCHFRIENQPSSLADSRGLNAPPPNGGKGPGIPHRGAG